MLYRRMSDQAKQKKFDKQAFQDSFRKTENMYLEGQITVRKTQLIIQSVLEDIDTYNFERKMDWVSVHTQLISLQIEVDSHTEALHILFRQLHHISTSQTVYPPTQFYPESNTDKSNPAGPWDEPEE